MKLTEATERLRSLVRESMAKINTASLGYLRLSCEEEYSAGGVASEGATESTDSYAIGISISLPDDESAYVTEALWLDVYGGEVDARQFAEKCIKLEERTSTIAQSLTGKDRDGMAEFLRAESERIDNELKQEVLELEEYLKSYKKVGIFGILVVTLLILSLSLIAFLLN